MDFNAVGKFPLYKMCGAHKRCTGCVRGRLMVPFVIIEGVIPQQSNDLVTETDK